MKPVFSIIIPTYNSSSTIKRCLDSIILQQFNSYEIIIIDGVSIDDTLSIVETYKDSRIRVFSEPDKGIYDAMNKGIKLASGEWFYFLGSDDFFLDSQILKILSELFILKYDLIYGNTLWNGIKTGGEFSKFDLVRGNINHQAIFYRRWIFEKLGNYNLSYKVWADYEFNLRCFGDTTINTKYIDIDIAHYTMGGFSSKFHLDDKFCRNALSIFKNKLKVSTNSTKYGIALEYFSKNEVRNRELFWGSIHLIKASILTKKFAGNLKFLFRHYIINLFSSTTYKNCQLVFVLLH